MDIPGRGGEGEICRYLSDTLHDFNNANTAKGAGEKACLGCKPEGEDRARARVRARTIARDRAKARERARVRRGSRIRETKRPVLLSHPRL